MRILQLSLFYLFSISSFAQPNTKIKTFINDTKNQYRWLAEYASFLSIPNVFGDSVTIYKNAARIKEMMEAQGIKSTFLHSGVNGSSPAVFGEIKVANAKTTLLFYAHYDGQPVNAAQWAEGLEPFTPTLLTARHDKGGKKINFPAEGDKIEDFWRLYARGSSDDKAGVFAIIKAYETLIKNGIKPAVNLKFIFEGEEEVGSINLDKIFIKHQDLLKADLCIITDGPRNISGKKQIVFGVRGDLNVDIKVYGAKRPLHSGNYGNWAPNPAMRLAQLLASMKDEHGMVTIKGFYDDVTPLTTLELKAFESVPDVEAILKEDLMIVNADGNGKSFKELLTLPTLNINGIQSANIGTLAANVIPTEAIAVLDLRLVAGNDIERQFRKLIAHVESKGYFVVDREPTDEERKTHSLIAKITARKGGYNAQRTSIDLPIAQKVVQAVQSTVAYPVIKVPSLGGSLPLFMFEQYLNTKPITIPIVNYDNNQHAENENIQLSYLWEGIETMSTIMALMK